METIKIHFKRKDYEVETKKVLYVIDVIKNIEPNEKSIVKMLKSRDLMHESFLSKINLL